MSTSGRRISNGKAKPRSIGPANRSMKVFFEDDVPGAFFDQPEKAEKIALHLERSEGWSERPWSFMTLAKHIADLSYSNGDFKEKIEKPLIAEMVDRNQAKDEACFTEFHFSQPSEAAADYGSQKLTAAPAGRKQIWCEYGTGCGWPLGGSFLSIELVYPEGEEQLDILDLCRQFSRTCRSLAKNHSSKFPSALAYIRVVQREATSDDEVGAHVYHCPDLSPEFAEEWGYPRSKWYEFPCIYL